MLSNACTLITKIPCVVCILSFHALILVLSPVMAGADEVRHRFITIGTGSPTGAYFAAGKAICDAVNRASARKAASGKKIVTSCRSGPSGGSAFNIRQVASGAFTFAIVQANDQHAALVGDHPERIRKVPGLRSVLSLHPEMLHIVVPDQTAIRSVSDFAGRRVSSGNRGSGTRLITRALTEAFGLSEGSYDPVESMTMELQASALCSGKIDAFTTMTAAPAASFVRAAKECNAQLMPLQGDNVRKLVSGSKNLIETKIPAGVYPTVETPIASIGVRAGLVTRAEVPDEIVAEVITAVIDELPTIRNAHASLASLELEKMAREGHGAPIHRGARAIFSQRGWR